MSRREGEPKPGRPGRPDLNLIRRAALIDGAFDDFVHRIEAEEDREQSKHDFTVALMEDHRITKRDLVKWIADGIGGRLLLRNLVGDIVHAPHDNTTEKNA